MKLKEIEDRLEQLRKNAKPKAENGKYLPFWDKLKQLQEENNVVSDKRLQHTDVEGTG
jgi:hypothetical protein